MSSSTTSITSRIPGLDGLRGIAALLVVLSHLSIRKMHVIPGVDFGGIGKSGVYLFFVLSAMLLASQMLAWESPDYLKPRLWLQYLQRRVFRIWPLFMLAVLVSLATTLYGPAVLGGRGLPSIVTTETLLPVLLLTEKVPLLWTVAAEFKFYFILPLICFVIHGLYRSRLVPSLVFLLLTAWMALSFYPPESSGVSPFPFMTLFLAGVMCAVVYRGVEAGGGVVRTVLEIIAWTSVLLYLATIPSVYGWLTGTVVQKVIFHHSHIMYALIWSVMILAMLYGRGLLRRVLDSKPLVFVGKISYSLYLWHLCVLIPVFRMVDYPPLVKGWIALTGALLLASASYYLVERPILSWSAALGRSRILRG